MYYITIKVALPVSGLGIIRIFNYIIIRVFYACEFWSPWNCLPDGVSICLVRQIRSACIFGPWDQFISSTGSFRRDRIRRDTGTE